MTARPEPKHLVMLVTASGLLFSAFGRRTFHPPSFLWQGLGFYENAAESPALWAGLHSFKNFFL